MPRAIKGKTDLWTTRPDVASMLVDKELGYTVTSGTHKKADFICQDCGSVIKDKYIRKVCSDGLRCPFCHDGISYPEKFMSCVFNELGIVPVRDSGMPWSGKKRYDFYIEELSLIVETHGYQHYSKRHEFHTSSNRDEKSNDEYKRNLALKNGIEHYIELDCRMSDFDFIKSSVMNSELVNLLDIDSINWDNVKIGSLKSLMIEACSIYNSGVSSASQIAQILKIDKSTSLDYLHKGTEIGLCNYIPYSNRRDMICVDTQKIYHSLDEVAADGYNKSQVSALCNHYPHINTVGGHNWCFLDEYNPETFIMKPYDERAIPKRVICYETGKIYERLVDVQQDGFSPSGVSNVCNGRRKHYKHKHFGFVDEEDIEQLRLYAL